MIVQRKEWVGVDAGVGTAQGSRWTAKIDQSQRSEWIGADDERSVLDAQYEVGTMTWTGGKSHQELGPVILTSSSVSRWNGQNISSSSRSKDLAASKSRLNAMELGGSTTNSFGVRT